MATPAGSPAGAALGGLSAASARAASIGSNSSSVSARRDGGMTAIRWVVDACQPARGLAGSMPWPRDALASSVADLPLLPDGTAGRAPRGRHGDGDPGNPGRSGRGGSPGRPPVAPARPLLRRRHPGHPLPAGPAGLRPGDRHLLPGHHLHAVHRRDPGRRPRHRRRAWRSSSRPASTSRRGRCNICPSRWRSLDLVVLASLLLPSFGLNLGFLRLLRAAAAGPLLQRAASARGGGAAASAATIG